MGNPSKATRHQRHTRAHWQHLIDQQVASHVPQRAFCNEQGVAYSSFCYWKRKLARTDQSATEEGKSFLELLSPRAVAAPGWEVELEFGAGMCLRLSRR